MATLRNYLLLKITLKSIEFQWIFNYIYVKVSPRGALKQTNRFEECVCLRPADQLSVKIVFLKSFLCFFFWNLIAFVSCEKYLVSIAQYSSSNKTGKSSPPKTGGRGGVIWHNIFKHSFIQHFSSSYFLSFFFSFAQRGTLLFPPFFCFSIPQLGVIRSL